MRPCRQLTLLVQKLYSHDRKFVHGDLSSRNVLVSREGKGEHLVHLIDFGSATERLTPVGEISALTAAYADPALLSNPKLPPSQSSDLWSLGVLIHECLDGIHPFVMPEPFDQQRWIEFLSKGVVRTHVPEQFGTDVRRVLTNWLQAKQGNRIESFESMLRALDEASKSTPIVEAELARRLQTKYLKSLVRRFKSFRLPIPDDDGHPILVPIDRVFIDCPIDITAVHSRKIGNEKQSFNIRDPRIRPNGSGRLSLKAVIRRRRNVIIEGVPGSGKSSLIAHCVRIAAQQELGWLEASSSQSSDRLHLSPIFLDCRDAYNRKGAIRLIEAIRQQLKAFGFRKHEASVLADEQLSWLSAGRAILFIDGLDEITNREARRAFCKDVMELAEQSDAVICVTNRPLGYLEVAEFFHHFDRAEVAPLSPELQSMHACRLLEYMNQDSNWFVTWSNQNSKARRLLENPLMLTTLLQIAGFDPTATNQAGAMSALVRELIRRQRPHRESPLLTKNEVLPYLEILAIEMQRAGKNTISETDAIQLLINFRDSDPQVEDELRNRSVSDLLKAIVERLGLLHVAGMYDDKRGMERRLLKFYHNSVQEYLAGMAIIHGRLGEGATEAERVRNQFIPVLHSSLNSKPILDLVYISSGMSIITKEWQDVITMAISCLSIDHSGAADTFIRSLLPESDTPIGLARALTRFILEILEKEPEISPETIRLIAFAVSHFTLTGDCGGRGETTLLDRRLSGIQRTRYGQGVYLALLEMFIISTGDRRYKIGLMVLPRLDRNMLNNPTKVIRMIVDNIIHNNLNKRIQYGLYLTQYIYACYSGNSYIPQEHIPLDLCKDLMHQLFLLAEVDVDPAARHVWIWSIFLLIGASFPQLHGYRRLTSTEESKMIKLLSRIDDDDPAIGWVALSLTRSSGVQWAFAEIDLIKDAGIVAEGYAPQRYLSLPKHPTKESIIKLLSGRLSILKSRRAKINFSIALTRLGWFEEEMVEPLIEQFCDNTGSDYRNEAFLGLTQIRNNAVYAALRDAANSDDYYINYDALKIILVHGDPNVLKSLVGDADPNRKFRCKFAYGLAGIADPLGRQYLKELATDPREAVRQAAEAGLKKAGEWGWLND